MSEYARNATLAASIDELKPAPDELVRVADVIRHRKLFAEMMEAWHDDTSLETILGAAARCAALACGAPMAKVLEWRSSDNLLIVKAQYGMGDESIGRSAGAVERGNPAGEALAAVKPVVEIDLRRRPPDKLPALFADLNVVTSVNLPLINRGGAYGILEVDYREQTAIGALEMSFLASVASALAERVEHHRARAAITAERDAKAILLREQQHRIRNNFQVIVAMLQRNASQAKDPQVRADYRDVGRKVFAMVSLFDHLLGLGEHGEHVDLGRYLGSMVASFQDFYDLRRNEIALEIDVEFGIIVDMDVGTTVGTIVNELVANAVEHAFDGKHGHIKIGLHRRPTGGYEVSVADSGRGLAPDWQENIGLRTSRRMIGNIGGVLSLHSVLGHETKWTLTLPGERK